MLVADYFCEKCLSVKTGIHNLPKPKCCSQDMAENVYFCKQCNSKKTDVPDYPKPECCKKVMENTFAIAFHNYTAPDTWDKAISSFMGGSTNSDGISKGWIKPDKEGQKRLEAWLKRTTYSAKKKIGSEELLKGEIEYRKLKQLFQLDLDSIKKLPEYKHKNITQLIKPYLAAFTQYYMHNSTHRPTPGQGLVQQTEYDNPLYYFRSQIAHPTHPKQKGVVPPQNSGMVRFIPKVNDSFKRIHAGVFKSNASISNSNLLEAQHTQLKVNTTDIQITNYYQLNKPADKPKVKQTSLLENNLDYRWNTNKYLAISGKHYINFKVFTSKGHPNLYIQINKPPFTDNNYDPTKVEHTEGWVNVILSFFGGLLNFLMNHAQADVRVIRRQSFGFSRPTLTDAGQAIRLSLGNQPPSFVFIVENALEILDQAICLLEKPIVHAGLCAIERSRSPNGLTPGANVFRYSVRSGEGKLKLLERAEETIKYFVSDRMTKALDKDDLTAFNALKDTDSNLVLSELNKSPTNTELEERRKQLNNQLDDFKQRVKAASEEKPKTVAKETNFSQAFNHFIFNFVILSSVFKFIDEKKIADNDSIEQRKIRISNIMGVLGKTTFFSWYKKIIEAKISEYDPQLWLELNKIKENDNVTDNNTELRADLLQARKKNTQDKMLFTGLQLERLTNLYKKYGDSPFDLKNWPLINQLEAIIAHLTPKIVKWSQNYNEKCFEGCYKYTFQKVHNNIEKGKFLMNTFNKLKSQNEMPIYINVQSHFYSKAIIVIESLLENVIILKAIHKMRAAIKQESSKNTGNKEKLKTKFCGFYGLDKCIEQVKFFHAEGGQAALALSFVCMKKLIVDNVDKKMLKSFKSFIYVENPYYEVWEFLKDQGIFTETDIEKLAAKTEKMNRHEHNQYVKIRENIRNANIMSSKNSKAKSVKTMHLKKTDIDDILGKIGKIDNDVKARDILECLVQNKSLSEIEKENYIKLQSKHNLFDKKIILTDASPALTVYPENDKLDVNLVEDYKMLPSGSAIIIDVTNTYLFGEKIKSLIDVWKKEQNKFVILASSLLKNEQLGLDKYQAGRIIVLCPADYKKYDQTIFEKLESISKDSFHGLSHSYINLLQNLLYPDSDQISMDIDVNKQKDKEKSELSLFKFDNRTYKYDSFYSRLDNALIAAANDKDINNNIQCGKAFIVGCRNANIYNSLSKDLRGNYFVIPKKMNLK